MSVLDEVLIEEHERMTRMKLAMEKELAVLPKGYVSRKSIHGREYCYFQRREGGKIVSSFIRSSELPSVLKQVERRKQLIASIKQLEADMNKISKVIE